MKEAPKESLQLDASQIEARFNFTNRYGDTPVELEFGDKISKLVNPANLQEIEDRVNARCKGRRGLDTEISTAQIEQAVRDGIPQLIGLLNRTLSEGNVTDEKGLGGPDVKDKANDLVRRWTDNLIDYRLVTPAERAEVQKARRAEKGAEDFLKNAIASAGEAPTRAQARVADRVTARVEELEDLFNDNTGNENPLKRGMAKKTNKGDIVQ